MRLEWKQAITYMPILTFTLRTPTSPPLHLFRIRRAMTRPETIQERRT